MEESKSRSANQKQNAVQVLDQSSSGREDDDSFDENDNQYTDPEEDKSEDEQASDEDQGEQQIDTSTISSQRKQYKGNFSATNDEQYGCPYGLCGRKFVSADMLKQHIERRHPTQSKEESAPRKQSNQISRDQISINANNTKSQLPSATPIRTIARKDIQPSSSVTNASSGSNASILSQAQIIANAHKKQSTDTSTLPSSLQQPSLQPKRFEEDKLAKTSFGFFQAAPRPVTSHGRSDHTQVSSQQAQILRDLMGGASNPGAYAKRPQTAATTTKKDESRIKKKLQFLEGIERKIEEDLEEFNNRKKAKQEQGVKVTKAMILEASQCDTLDQVQTIILRDKNIEQFDDNKQDGFKLEELVNCEAIYASHNMIKDIFGICQISTLVDLNLSFNQISDIQPLEDLVLLQKLFLNRNSILVIDPLKALKNLKVLGLFNNEIMNEKKSIEVLEHLQNLEELSIDGNPVSSQVRFKYELIMRLRKLEMLDDEPIKELDKDVAEQYFIQNKLPLPNTGIIKKNLMVQYQASDSGRESSQAEDNALKENQNQQVAPLRQKKSVKFQKSLDDDGNTWQSDEIKKLEAKCAELIVENEEYKVKLQQRHYDQVYRDNQIMQLELKNMYILQEENKDLREELEQLRSLTYEDKVRQLVEENNQLKKRNGMLLIQVADLETQITELSRSQQDRILEEQKNMRSNMNSLARPSTSAGAFMRKKEDTQMTCPEDFIALQETAQDDFDKELDALILKNQQRLAELQSDVKEVSKIYGEPVVNVRKIKQVRSVKPAGAAAIIKNLNLRQQQASATALGADLIAENDENN